VVSATQVDKLGERLRAGPVTADDLRLLDDYRRSFAPAISEVVRVLRQDFQLEPTAREAKSSRAILAKLGRSTTTLSTMQDIAGCRVLLASRASQQGHAEALLQRFPQAKLIDRIARPSFGYRALHLVVKQDGRRVEIQLRTVLQHLWAQLCEHLSDQVGIGLKYGQGPQPLLAWLCDLSDAVRQVEDSGGRHDAAVDARLTLLRQARFQPDVHSAFRQALDEELVRALGWPQENS
jgi:putative GTP pyrophosphokinase